MTDTAAEVWGQQMRQYIADMEEQKAIAADLYPQLVRLAKRLRLRRLTYRCQRHRDLLLDAIQTPDTIIMHQPAFRQAEARNLARSSESGRRANTTDGNNHWRSRTYPIGHSALQWQGYPEMASLEIVCEHCSFNLKHDEFWRDWNTGKTEVIVPAERCL